MGTGGKRIPVRADPGDLPSPEDPPSLYVHVPFCRVRCAYCDFYSRAVGPGSPGPAGEAFLESLHREWDLRGGPGPFSTIYVGGGTPTVLALPTFKGLLNFLSPLLLPDGEWTLEANPESLDPARLEAMKEAGVSRLSLGVQSLREKDLRFLGRAHDKERALEALELAGRLGPPGISADLLLGLPGQGEWDVEEEIDVLLRMGVEHVSFYILTLEEGTPLYERVRRGEAALPPPEIQARLLLFTRAALAGRGLPPYEISNAAITGRECRHNLRYWLGGDYLGMGPSAAGFTGGSRWRNFQDLETWAEAVMERRLPVEEEEALPPRKAASERAWLQLRTARGLALKEVLSLTDPPDSWAGRAEDLASFLLEKGLLEKKDGRFILTEEGVLQADGVGAAFLDLA